MHASNQHNPKENAELNAAHNTNPSAKSSAQPNALLAIFIGVLSALFFAVTFVLNHVMSHDGGSWIWSAALRFFFMVPLLVVLVVGFAKLSGNSNSLRRVVAAFKMQPLAWLVWSTVGFGVFYAPLTFAADYAPAWLVASTWQVTIIAGLVMTPFLFKAANTVKTKDDTSHNISKKTWLFSGIILTGIVLTQLQYAQAVDAKTLLYGVLPIVIAAFAYPLGNRKMMQLRSVQDCQLNPFERTLGMTLASLPFWLVLSCIGIFTADLPSNSQITQTFIVAICSGVIATTLFFMATDMVKHNPKKLAAVEATQSAEVVFALIGEMIILGSVLPTGIALVGIGLVIFGMVLHSSVH